MSATRKELNANTMDKSKVLEKLYDPILWIYINDLPDDVICNVAIYADNTTLYSNSDQASDLLQQLEFIWLVLLSTLNVIRHLICGNS